MGITYIGPKGFKEIIFGVYRRIASGYTRENIVLETGKLERVFVDERGPVFELDYQWGNAFEEKLRFLRRQRIASKKKLNMMWEEISTLLRQGNYCPSRVSVAFYHTTLDAVFIKPLNLFNQLLHDGVKEWGMYTSEMADLNQFLASFRHEAAHWDLGDTDAQKLIRDYSLRIQGRDYNFIEMLTNMEVKPILSPAIVGEFWNIPHSPGASDAEVCGRAIMWQQSAGFTYVSEGLAHAIGKEEPCYEYYADVCPDKDLYSRVYRYFRERLQSEDQKKVISETKSAINTAFAERVSIFQFLKIR